MRRSGRTSQSVSVKVNCATDAGGRTRITCIQKRSSKTPPSTLATVSTIN
jgi:hypothetical protein